MTDDERDALLAAFLAKTISPADRDRLHRELRSDPRFARKAHDAWAVEQVLSLELDTRARRAFVETVAERIRGLDAPSEPARETAEDAVEEPPPPPVTEPDAR